MPEAASTTITNDIFVGRQPILDRENNVFGYELLFRSGDHGHANVIDGNLATSQVIINTFLEIGLENICDDRHTFINLTSDFLSGEIPLPLHPQNVVLEVLEDVEINDQIIAAIKSLAAKGFMIALDDFVLTEKNQVLVSLADIIKVDLMALSEEELRRQVAIYKRFNLKLLAEKVETQAEYEMCKQLGFEYFQGYYFAKPNVVSGKQLPANRMALLEMIAKLQSPDCDMRELEEIISKDVAISYKLLRIINSPFYGMTSKVDSIKRALVVIGLDALKSWVTVIGLSQVGDKPAELINISLVRAKMCEQLAKQLGCSDGIAFTTGLFSLLDVLMDRPLDELLEKLPLDDRISHALIKQDGPLGDILKLVSDYEKGDWLSIDTSAISGEAIQQAYLDSLNWASEIIHQIENKD